VTRRFLVSGMVQGVGFRYFVVRHARDLDLVGWVRNRSDGTVEVVADGQGPALSAFEGRLWEGPPHSRVTGVESSEAEPPRWDDFRVLPTPW
jgi:acylphosphatase